MVDVLISNGFVLTMDEGRRIIEGGAVAIEDKRVVDVGRAGDLKKRHPADITIDAKGGAVLPGLVNVHTHLPSLFVRGVYGVVTEGLYKILFPIKRFIKPRDMYTFGLASCLEALNFGSTCVVETYNHLSHFARAAEETGIRGVLGEQVADVNYDKLMDGVYEYLPEQGEEMLKRGIRLVEDWDGRAEGRIRTILAPLAPDMCTPETYVEAEEAAERYGKRVTTHLAQSLREVRQVEGLYGKTPAQHLRDLGLMTPKLTSAHCIHLTDEDLRIVKDSGMAILHCPRPYLLDGTTAPLARWLDQGIGVGLGTDNVHHDMFQTMRAALYAARLRARVLGEAVSANRPTLAELLEMATIKGAELYGLEGEIGSIEVGKRADVIVVNLRSPHMTPTADVLSSLILYASGGDVDAVIVDGRMVKEGGELTMEGKEDVLARAQELSDGMWSGFWEENPELKRKWEGYLAWRV